jgi:hypothetical protein
VEGLEGRGRNAARNQQKGMTKPRQNRATWRLTGDIMLGKNGISNEGVLHAGSSLIPRRSLCKCGDRIALPTLLAPQIGRRVLSVQVPGGVVEASS